MGNCQFYLPTQIFFGRNCVIEQVPMILKDFGEHALIVTGQHSAKINGALEDMIQVLKKNHQTYQLFDQIMSNPSIDCVYAGAELARQIKADFIIAIGGGSPMDAGKAISLLACQNIPKDQLFCQRLGNEALPLICIPTTSGTGSEVTQYSVLTNDSKQTKSSLAHSCLFPKIALLDGKYMMSLSRTVTIHTVLDAFSHLVESMLSKKADSWSQMLALKGIQMLKPYLEKLDSMEFTVEDRDILLQVSLLGGIVIAQTSTTAVHLLGYPLTYFHHIDHGRANALVMGAYLTLIEQREPQALQKILQLLELMRAKQINDIIDRLLGPREILTKVEINHFAEVSMQSPKSQSGIIALDEKDIKEIYYKSFCLQK